MIVKDTVKIPIMKLKMKNIAMLLYLSVSYNPGKAFPKSLYLFLNENEIWIFF